MTGESSDMITSSIAAGDNKLAPAKNVPQIEFPWTPPITILVFFNDFIVDFVVEYDHRPGQCRGYVRKARRKD
jgi:hypothetical protein